MKLMNVANQKDHDARLETLKDQQAEQVAQLELLRPQALDFEQNNTDKPIELKNDVVCMPGDYYNPDMNIVVSKDDTDWEVVS